MDHLSITNNLELHLITNKTNKKNEKYLNVLIYQNDTVWLLLLLHRFSAFSPGKSIGRP